MPIAHGFAPVLKIVHRALKRIFAIGGEFLKDFRDKGAKLKSSTAIDLVTMLSLVCVSLGAVAGSTDNLQNLLLWITPLPVATVPLLCGAVGFLWAIGVITLKDRREEEDSLGFLVAVTQYRYAQPPRVLAKAAVLPSIAIAALSGFRIWHDAQPLDGVVYGVIRDSIGPLSGVTIQIYTAENHDLTKTSWKSDSEGFYMVELNAPAPRSAHLVAISSECPSRDVLLLLRVRDEMPSDSLPPVAKGLSPVFRHTIRCREIK